MALNNINFESYLPKENFSKYKKLDKKIFNNSIKEAKKNLKLEKDVFHSFGKNFKLNIELSKLKKFKKFKRVVIIGMGGSILGSEAVNNFLKEKSKKEIIFINNLNFQKISHINKLKNLKNSLFFLISKSGNTIEILSIINSLLKKASFNKNNTLVITENKQSELNKFAKSRKIKIIKHRSYIGGRYSVFSETALIPCYFMDIDIFKFKKNILNFLFKKRSILINNLINLAYIYNSKKINALVLLNYCPGLEQFLLWCQQLIAESLGKRGQGIIPVLSIGPRDHHSLLQLYLDGPKDKFFYIFSIKENKGIKVVKNLFKDTLNNSNISKILTNQKRAMKSVFKSKKIPFFSFEIKKRNEETLGELFSYFMIETIFLGQNLKMNPFDQPAVEDLKIITKKNLFKKIQK